MGVWHGYVLLQLKATLPLTADQRGKVRDVVHGMAVREEKRPWRMFQARVSLDGNQAAYEAVWDRDKVTPGAVTIAVAGALGIPPGQLAGNVEYRFFADGGFWEDSRRAVLEFLSENAAEWEPML